MSEQLIASASRAAADAREDAAQAPASLVADWLRADPDLTFKSARRDAERLSLRLTPQVFAEARKTLGMTAPPPRPPQAKRETEARTAVGNTTMKNEKRGSPLMAFAVEFIKNEPAAEYAVVKAAAAERGMTLPPIVFGRARKALGLVGDRKTAPKRQSASASAKPRGARAKSSSESIGDLGHVLGRLQEMAGDRDRFQDALREIDRILRDVL